MDRLLGGFPSHTYTTYLPQRKTHRSSRSCGAYCYAIFLRPCHAPPLCGRVCTTKWQRTWTHWREAGTNNDRVDLLAKTACDLPLLDDATTSLRYKNIIHSAGILTTVVGHQGWGRTHLTTAPASYVTSVTPTVSTTTGSSVPY
ncbi:hypothetical protein Pcinc_021158 [Petrolisthes cinctipes]|uniref:Uncharacterized protein n=1 Tax=Petrolisthes cinctipes TaxID=88211 RepID=A0AAE1FGI9_PETCI|nr:hypothetical protein Pcinc_021158 [Petrolisthes cinctipes]